jgi:hypothetical protein
MTVVPGSIHALITAIKLSAVLSGMGTKNVLLDSRSTPPNTHCPLTGCPLWYLRRTNLALDGLVRTADLLGAAFHVHEHGLSAELAPVRDRSRTEVMLLFDKGGRFAARHVVREKHNLLESEVTMLKPWSVLDRFGLKTHGNRFSTTPPSKTVAFRVSAPDHIATAIVTRHLVANQSHALQKLDAKIHVDEEIREKLVRLFQARYARKIIVERRASSLDAADILILHSWLDQPLFPLENHTVQLNTIRKLPQQRIPHWQLNATAWVGVGRKARKTWGPYCNTKDLSRSSSQKLYKIFYSVIRYLY